MVVYSVNFNKMKKTKTDNGKNGGELKGVYHDSPSGGIPATIEDSGRGILVESDEVIINRRSAQCTDCTHVFDGKRMTNKEILSAINTEKGGVPIYESGGNVMQEGGTVSSIEQKIKAFETLLGVVKDAGKKRLIEKKISAFKILSKVGVAKEKEPDMSQFIEIIRKSNSFDDAYNKVAAIKDVSHDKSEYFAAKYNPDKKRTSKEAFLIMYNEYKIVPEREKNNEEKYKNFEIGQRYYDRRYADFFEITNIEQRESDAYITQKYDKGETRNEWASGIEYNISNGQYSLEIKETVSETKKEEGSPKFYQNIKDTKDDLMYTEKSLYATKNILLPFFEKHLAEEKTQSTNNAIEEYINNVMKFDIQYVNEKIRPEIGKESSTMWIDGIVTEEKIQEYLGKERERRRIQAENFVKLVYEKENYERLLDILTNKDNKASRKLFTKLTGISLGSTIADSKNAVNSYFGSDVVAESKKKAEQAEKERKESYRQRQIDSELSQKVRVGGEIITYKEHYDKAMQNGYNVIEMTKRGNFPIMHLKNKDTSSFWIIKKKIHMDYIREKLGKND